MLSGQFDLFLMLAGQRKLFFDVCWLCISFWIANCEMNQLVSIYPNTSLFHFKDDYRVKLRIKSIRFSFSVQLLVKQFGHRLK